MFLKKFKKDIKVDKGFLIFDTNDDFFRNTNIIESICNEYHYNIIRIDQLEVQKVSKLAKISEASQSQRIFTLKDSLNDKTKYLQNVLSQTETIDSSLANEILLGIQENSLTSLHINKNPDNTNEIHINSGEKKDNNDNTPNIESIKNIVENIRNIGSTQKNLILICDQFLNFEEDRNFFHTLVKIVSNSKCPVVVVTSNLVFI